MTHPANLTAPEPGRLRRAIAAAWAFLQAMESTGLDYTLDRIERLEREVARLKEELRQSGDPGMGDAHIASVALPDPEKQGPHDAGM